MDLIEPKILLVDDETEVLNIVRPALTEMGCSVVYVENGTKALEIVSLEKPDLVLLDLKMPGMTGLDVCKALKANLATAEIPVIILSGMKTEVDRIVALEIGVDDYVTKPFSLRELMLRIQAVLRRSHQESQGSPVKQIGGLVLDSARFTVRYKEKPLRLTPIEFKLLESLIDHTGHLQSREMLFQNVWSGNPTITTRTEDTHIQRLRDKLGRAGRFIETVRGKGYKMVESSRWGSFCL